MEIFFEAKWLRHVFSVFWLHLAFCHSDLMLPGVVSLFKLFQAMNLVALCGGQLIQQIGYRRETRMTRKIASWSILDMK